MVKFISKFSVFLFIFICIICINMGVNYLLYSNYFLVSKCDTILIAGDSHPQKAIRTNILTNAKNISQTSEPYVLTFWKLKKVFDFCQPSTLILGFAPHNISEFNDFKFSESKWSNEMFRRSYSVAKFKDIDNQIPIDYLTYFKVVSKQIGFYPKINHLNLNESYSNNKNSNIDDYKTAINRHYYKDDKVLSLSIVSLAYLDSIVNLCQDNNVNLVLISSPVHLKYYEKIPKPILNKFSDLKNKYKRNNLVIDELNAGYSDSLFLNSDHLNEYGATLFTKEIKDILIENQLINQ